MSTSVNVKIDEAQAKEMAKKAGAKALELGKKGLSTGKAAFDEAHKAGLFEMKNFKEFNSSLVQMINTVKGDAMAVKGGAVSAKDAVMHALAFKADDPDGGFKFMCGALPAPGPHLISPAHAPARAPPRPFPPAMSISARSTAVALAPPPLCLSRCV